MWVPLSPSHGMPLGWGWPPAMEGSCDYIEYAATDKQQAVVFQLGGLAWG
jgi:hypothetical protein